MKKIKISSISIFFSLLVTISCSRKPTEPGVEILPDMVHSVAYEAFTESKLTPNGSSMLEAPQGSISRGYKPFRYGKTVDEAIRAGRELKNPIPLNDKSIERGRTVYINSCQVCHGDTGKGDGPIIPKFPNPPSFTTEAIKNYPDGRIYHVIVAGFGDMPGHHAQLNEEDRWDVVNFIRKLQQP